MSDYLEDSKKDDDDKFENKTEPAIVALVNSGLRDSDPRTVEAALTELANLSYGNANAANNRISTAMVGGLLAIVQAMDVFPHDPEVLAAAGRAFQNLALDPNNKAGIAAAGGIEALVTVMKEFPNEPAVLMGGCGTFQNLIWGNDENRMKLLKTGAIHEIINAINAQPASSDVVDWAAGCLYLLSMSPEMEIREALVKDGAISALANAIEQHFSDLSIKDKARNALARLLW